METRQSYGRHIAVAITCAFYMFFTAGAVFSAAGIYYTGIAEDFGVMRSQIVLWITIAFLAATVTMPYTGRLFANKDARIICSIGAILIVIGEFIFAGAQSIEWLYVGAVPIGIGLQALGFVAPSTMLNRWFKKKIGLVLGIVMAMSGVGGIVFNYIGAAVLSAGNWHIGFAVTGICVLVIALPLSIFAIRSYPSDCGLKMYGEDDDASDEEADKTQKKALYGITASRAKKMLTFYLCIIFSFIAVFGTNCYQFFASYAQALPVTQGDLAFAATLASTAMIGQLIGKIVLGMIADKSLTAASVISFACGIVGVLMMILLTSSQITLLAGAFIFGWFYAAINVISPLLVRAGFGTVEYSVIWARVSALNTFASAISMTVLAIVMDMFGFTTMFAIPIVVCIVCAIISLYVIAHDVKPEDGILD